MIDDFYIIGQSSNKVIRN